MSEARIEGVRIAWDEDERVLKFTCVDPRGQFLIKNCVFWNVDQIPVECWLGDRGDLRFGAMPEQAASE